MILDTCDLPIVLAPLAGGPSTPELAAAVSNAGGLGFVAGGYLSAADLAARIAATRRLTGKPFGVNLFVPGPAGPAGAVRDYARAVADEAGTVSATAGEPRHDDDGWTAKIELLLDGPPPVVSFTFGLPDPAVLRQFRAAGAEVWVTVASVNEAVAAGAAGADVLVVQGAEAGGHAAVATTRRRTPLACSRCCNSSRRGWTGRWWRPGASPPAPRSLQCSAVARERPPSAPRSWTAPRPAPPVCTDRRCTGPGHPAHPAFTGRTARGIVNGFLERHTADAPAAYPEVHHRPRRCGRPPGPRTYRIWSTCGPGRRTR